jgi:hypothetical protein
MIIMNAKPCCSRVKYIQTSKKYIHEYKKAFPIFDQTATRGNATHHVLVVFQYFRVSERQTASTANVLQCLVNVVIDLINGRVERQVVLLRHGIQS